jgi:hypothetical protein
VPGAITSHPGGSVGEVGGGGGGGAGGSGVIGKGGDGPGLVQVDSWVA